MPAKEISADRSISCPGCAYDLRAHLHDQGACCPECGCRFRLHEFDPGETLPIEQRQDRVALMLVPLIAALMTGVASMCINLTVDAPIEILAVIVLMVGLGVSTVVSYHLTMDDMNRRFVLHPVWRFIRYLAVVVFLNALLCALPILTCMFAVPG